MNTLTLIRTGGPGPAFAVVAALGLFASSALGVDWLAVPVAEVRAAAEKGGFAAQHALGERLLGGRDGKADLLGAYEWFGRAGSNGVVEAQLRMGMRHERAVGGGRDISEAARWYELAAEKGSEAARFRLACIHSLNRHAGRLDGNETARWIQPLVERGHEPARQLFRAAGTVMRATNVPPAQLQAWLREAAEAGGAADQQQLAEQLIVSDPKAAVYWWEVSRLGGSTNVSFRIARAQARLSDAEIAVEVARAKQFKPKVRPAGAPAVVLAGLDALHHVEVELQPTAASHAEFTRFEAAANGGSTEAQFQLGLIHQLAPAFTNHLAALDGSRRVGNGVLMNNDRVPQPHLDEAVRWHTAAAQQGHGGAALCAAWLLHSGVLGTARTAEAVPWFKVAGEAGHAESAYRYALFRLAGFDVEKSTDPAAPRRNYEEALKWMERAANKGWVPAQTNLAERMYRAAETDFRYGSQTDALRLLRDAADKGDPGAKERLLRWFGVKHGSPVQVAAVGTAPAASGSPRLAIVPLAEGLRPLADLLLAELSAKPGITLLERAEIDRVFREQSLNVANTGALKLGELLNAQGLVLLETNAMAGGAVASVRFVAVGPGVLLSAATVPLPLTNAPDWSQQLTAQFTPWLGKLAVRRGAAVPVSLLGFRMAAASTDAAEIEQGLSLLFLHRLARERDVFALERRSLEQLAAEQELGGTDNQFWSGSHLVDGAIERSLTDRSQLNVRLQFTPAGGSVMKFESSGATTNLAKLADELVVKLLAALRKAPTGTWNPEEEAIKFYEEAVWLRRWGQMRPATEAMESAWALGLRGPIHANLRLDLLLACLRFVPLQWHGTEEFPPVLRQPPDAANLEYAGRALGAFQSYSRSRSPKELAEDKSWLTKGANSLELVGKTLAEFYHATEHRAGREEKLDQLRAEARSTLAYLQTIPGLSGSPINLDRLQAVRARFWVDSPEEVLSLHRRLIQQPDFADLRYYFIGMLPSPLVAWNRADRPGLAPRWQEHLRSLGTSTNVAEQFEARLNELSSVPNSPFQTAEPKLAEAIRRFLDLAWLHREPLKRHAAGAHTISSSLSICRSTFATYAGSTGAGPAGERLEAIVAGYDKRFRDFQTEAGVAVAAPYLREAKMVDAIRFNDLVGRADFTPAQARELLPLAKEYSARFSQPPSLGAGLRHLSERAAVTLPDHAVVTASGPSLGANSTPLMVTTPGSPSPDALRVARFWLGPELRRPAKDYISYPLPVDHSVEHRHVEIHDWLWREDRLWLAWRHSMSVKVPREGWVKQECSHVAGYSLPGLAGDLNSDDLPAEVALARNEWPVERPLRIFEVLDGRVYVSGADGVWQQGKPAWRKLPVEVSGRPRLLTAHGRLMVSTPDALYAYEPKSETVTLLASARRRPPQHILDGTPSLRLAVGGPVSGHRLRVAFGTGGAYDYDFDSQAWSYLPLPGQRAIWHPDRLETVSSSSGGVYFGNILPHAATNSWLAAFRLPPPPRDTSALTTGIKLPGVPLWQPADITLSPAGLATTAMSNRLWSVTGANFHLGASNANTFLLSTNGYHVRLAAWHPELKQPAVIPLWLELPPDTLTPQSVARVRSHSSSDKLADATGDLLATPPGLVYRNDAVSGFWFIPWDEVLPRVERQFAQLTAARAARPLPPDNHRGKQLLQTYDADGDGKVSPIELAVLSVGEKLETPQQSWHRPGVSFTQFDRDRDGGLDSTELSAIGDLIKQRASGASPPGFGPPGMGGPTATPGRPGFPFGPGQPPRPGQLPVGPPPPEILERYDKNKNGKMDQDEMQELFRDQARGTAPRQPGAPSAVPAPQPPKK